MACAAEVVHTKRAREESIEDLDVPPSKRLNLQGDADPSQLDELPTVSEASPTQHMFNDEQLVKASEVIRREFGTEILLKHNELRLIDTEIAKCQVALEQIRRASLIPYPAQTGRVQDMLNVSTGSGVPLVPAGMQHPPSHPAPWGVTDGPYSRQYASWLISAPEFDGGLPTSRTHTAARTLGLERRGRGQYDESMLASSRSRTQRGSTSARLQALPLGYPQPKGSRGPLTLKRQSDNKWVKLVCQNCQREDFSSVQGFINHCRISHQVHFVTHEDAAQRAGTEESVDQETGEVSGTPTIVQARTSTSTTASANMASGSVANSTAATELVHKFNRHAVCPQTLFPAPLVTPPAMPTSFKRQRKQRRRSSNMGPPVSPGFIPSNLTPHLSSLFAKTGRAANLDALVREARTKEDIDGPVSPTTPDGVEAVSPLLTPRHAPATKHQLQGGLSAPSTTSRKGPGRMTALSSGGNATSTRHTDITRGSGQALSTSSADHSPSAAMDTNQAPSLVSDDGQSGSEGEEDEYRAGNTQHGEHRAMISNFDNVDDDLLPDGPSTMEVEEKIRNWKQKGDPRPPEKRQGPQMQT